MDWKFELVMIPVTDVDRAKDFYLNKAGFNLDVDHQMGDEFRIVQFTPFGSACSIGFGVGMIDTPPGSAKGMHLVVTDIEAAVDELTQRGVEMGEIHHYDAGKRTSGPHPLRENYNSFSSFADPDGNTWVLQERDYVGTQA